MFYDNLYVQLNDGVKKEVKKMDSLFKGCLYFTANRFARLMNKMAEEEFTRVGISPTYAFLMMLAYQYPGINQKELSEKLHIAPSTCTRFVDKLVNKGYMNRTTEGKQVLVTLTDSGKALIPEIDKAWNSLYVRYTDVMGKEQCDLLSSLIYQSGNTIEGNE